MKIKLLGIYDKNAKILRLIRLVRHNKSKKLTEWKSKKITIALCNKIFKIRKEHNGLILFVLGIRIHYKISHGGYLV